MNQEERERVVVCCSFLLKFPASVWNSEELENAVKGHQPGAIPANIPVDLRVRLGHLHGRECFSCRARIQKSESWEKPKESCRVYQWNINGYYRSCCGISPFHFEFRCLPVLSMAVFEAHLHSTSLVLQPYDAPETPRMRSWEGVCWKNLPMLELNRVDIRIDMIWWNLTNILGDRLTCWVIQGVCTCAETGEHPGCVGSMALRAEKAGLGRSGHMFRLVRSGNKQIKSAWLCMVKSNFEHQKHVSLITCVGTDTGT